MEIQILLLLIAIARPGIHIWEPKQLKNMYASKQIDYTIMNFGAVPYGHTIYGTVFIASPYNACSELSPLKWEKNYGTLILLVERGGGCNFSEKVINAQNIGAGFVMIADNNEEDVHKIFPIERSKELLDKVHIAAVLITKHDADAIRDVIVAEQAKPEGMSSPVELAIFFDLVKTNSKASLKFILQVDDFRSYDLLINYARAVGSIRNFIKLAIHFKVFINAAQFLDKDDCLSSGTNSYCVFKSFGNNKTDLGLVNETIRQLCLSTVDTTSLITYVTAVRQKCFDAKGSVLDAFKTCTQEVYEKTFSVAFRNKLTHCNEPGSPENQKAMAKNHDEVKYLLINYSPLIFINGAYYKGNYEDVNHLLESVCNAFDNSPAPCARLESFQSTYDLNSWHFFRFIVKSLIFACFIALAALITHYFLYRRKIKRIIEFELNDKINEALEKHYKTDESSTGDNTPNGST